MATYYRSRKGVWIKRKTLIGIYFYPQPNKELRASTCPKTETRQPFGKPAVYLQDNLACPLGEFLMFVNLICVISFRKS